MIIANLHFLLVLLMGVIIGSVAGYIGSLMASKKMTLMAGALGHLTMPGVSLAIIYGFDISIGALIFLIFGTIIIWLLQQKTKIAAESLTATVFASSLAIAFLIIPKKKASQALLGNISKISPEAIFITIIVCLIIFLVTKEIYSKMVLASISADLTKTTGVNLKKYNFIYLACISLIVALGVRIVGGLLTSALVAIPACAAKNISINLKQYAYFSLLFGGTACLSGILISQLTNLPAGPLVIISSATIFLISIFLKE